MAFIDWNQRVAAALNYLCKERKRILSPEVYCGIIDDVVSGLTIEEIMEKRQVKRDWIGRTTVGHVTTAIYGKGVKVPPLAKGGWYETNADGQSYTVAPGFIAAWKKARNLP